VIVNFGQLEDAFGSGHEAVAQLTGGDSGADDLEAAMVTATILRGITAIEDAQILPDVLSSTDDPVGAALQTILAENAAQLGTPRQLAAGGREVRFNNHDPRWSSTLIGLLKAKLNVGKFDFRAGPLTGHPLPDQTRVGILGDWGTNLYGAPHCAASIKRDGKFGALIHLGDVYYSGSESETSGRFLAEWPKVPGAINRACNSNHEMLSGGKPYVAMTLARFQQSSSLFWLENKHWVLLGLDSAYDDGQLGLLQVDWLRAICAKARSESKKVVFFSHHQPWRTDTGEVQPLVDPILDLLEDHQVAAWYWGHEHLCALFDPHPEWSLQGGCIGHSGFPYSRLDMSDWPTQEEVAEAAAWHKVPARDETPGGTILDGPNRWIPGHEATFGPNGYAVLELDGPNLREVIFTPSGESIHERILA
jgi:hypothetical protein